MDQYCNTIICALERDQLTQLILERKNIPLEQWRQICHLIHRSSNLHTIRITECSAIEVSGDIWLKTLLEALTYNRSVQHLALTSMKIREVATTECMQNMLLHNTVLQMIDLSSNDIDDDGLSTFILALQKCTNSALKQLILYDNEITGEKLTEEPASCGFGKLNSLDLSCNYFNTLAFQNLLTVLAHSTDLHSLILNNCITDPPKHWNEQAFQEWSNLVFKSNPRLSNLALNQNDLGDANISAILKSLLSNKIQLQSLELHDNNLTNIVLPALAEFVRNTPTLATLNLADNNIANSVTELSANSTVFDLNWARALEYINLDFNPLCIAKISEMADFISHTNAKKLVLTQVFIRYGPDNIILNELQRPQAVKQLADALGQCKASVLFLDISSLFDQYEWSTILTKLSHNQFIKQLMLNDCDNIDAVATDYWRALANNPQLQKLNIFYNDFPNETLKGICDAFAGNNTLRKLSLSTNQSDLHFSYIANLIKHNTALNTLTLWDYNINNYDSPLSEMSVQLLAEALSNNRTLLHLELPPANLASQTRRLLLSALETNQTLLKISFGYPQHATVLNQERLNFYEEFMQQTIRQLSEYQDIRLRFMPKMAMLLQRLEYGIDKYQSYTTDNFASYQATALSWRIALKNAFFIEYNNVIKITSPLASAEEEENIHYLLIMLEKHGTFIEQPTDVLQHYNATLHYHSQIYHDVRQILDILQSSKILTYEHAKKLNDISYLYKGTFEYIGRFALFLGNCINAQSSPEDKKKLLDIMLNNCQLASHLLEENCCIPLQEIMYVIDELHTSLDKPLLKRRATEWQQQISDERAEPELKRQRSA